MFLDPTDESVRALLDRSIEGPVVMLNLLRFKAIADYREFPHLAPRRAISGREAFDRYLEYTEPLIVARGASMGFMGGGGQWLIGPADERWDFTMLIKQPSVEVFLGYANDPEIMAGIGHRTAAVADSRLLPLTQRT